MYYSIHKKSERTFLLIVSGGWQLFVSREKGRIALLNAFTGEF